MPRAGLLGSGVSWGRGGYLERSGPAKLKAKTSPAKNNPTKALLFRMESPYVGLPSVEKCLGSRDSAGK